MENSSKIYNYEDFETISVMKKDVYTTFLVQELFSGMRYVKKKNYQKKNCDKLTIKH